MLPTSKKGKERKMINIKELEQQIARIDEFLQEAYVENNTQDIVLFAGLLGKLIKNRLSCEDAKKPKAVKAWKNVCSESSHYEAMLEARILARDEMRAMND